MEYKRHVFTTVEKKCFLNIIKKFFWIIESKDMHNNTWRVKNEAWDKVTAEYNGSPLVTSQATHKQLRILWMSLKQRHGQALKKKHLHRLDTEGESSASDTDSDPDVSIGTPALILRINTAINSETIQEIHNPNTQTNLKEKATVKPVTPMKKAFNVSETLDPTDDLIPHSSTPTSHMHKSTQCTTVNFMEKEYQDRRKRADEKHQLVMLILQEQLRKAKAQADSAELLLKQKPK